LVSEGKNGFLVPFGDVELLERKIGGLLKDKKKAELLGTYGKRFVKKYDWGEIVRQTLNIYEGIGPKYN